MSEKHQSSNFLVNEGFKNPSLTKNAKDSTLSMNSIESLGFVARPQDTLYEMILKETQMDFNFKQMDRLRILTLHLTDLIQFVIYCPQHKNKFLLQRFQSDALYFPFITLKSYETVHWAARKRILQYCQEFKLHKSMIDEPTLVDFLHLCIPPNDDYINRYTIRLEFKSNLDQCLCQTHWTHSKLRKTDCFGQIIKNVDNEKSCCQWVTIQELENQPDIFKQLWGPEPLMILRRCSGKNQAQNFRPILTEISLDMITKYLNETLQLLQHPLTLLLNNLNLSENDLYHLWLEYLLNTYPSVYMTRYSLQDFLYRSIGLFGRDLGRMYPNVDRLLRSWQIMDHQKYQKNIDNLHDTSGESPQSPYYINFDEFLNGLVYLDSECLQEKTPWLDIRIGYVFRYYSHNGLTLNYEDLVQICSDIHTHHFHNNNVLSHSLAHKQIEIFVKPSTKQDGETIETSDKRINQSIDVNMIKLTYGQFASLLKRQKKNPEVKYLNLHNMFTLSKPLNYHLHFLYGYEQQQPQQSPICLNRDLRHVIRIRNETLCRSCWKCKPIYIAEHIFKTDYFGHILDIYGNDKWVGPQKRTANKKKRNLSKLSVNLEGTANVIIDSLVNLADDQQKTIKYYRVPRPGKKAQKTDSINSRKITSPQGPIWSGKLCQSILANLLELCKHIDFLMLKQQETENVLRIQSPCILVKNVRQSTNILLNHLLIEQCLSNVTNMMFPIKYIFLFDWIDLEQNNGLELLFYWLANKMIFPNQYFLVMDSFCVDSTHTANDTIRNEKKVETQMNRFVLKIRDFFKREDHEINELCQSLISLLKRSKKIALIDDVVLVLCANPNPLKDSDLMALWEEFRMAKQKDRFLEEMSINRLVVVNDGQPNLLEIQSYDQSIEKESKPNLQHKFNMLDVDHYGTLTIGMILFQDETIKVVYF